MRDHERENDTAFDAFLENAVPELPPETIVAEVTPWKRSTNRVLTGMTFTTITLNFWCLNYILPAIGTILLLLGFRSLRKENRWFGCCFAVSVLRAACFFPSLVLNTTILQGAVYASIGPVLTASNLLLVFTQFVCLWRGFLSVQKKRGFLSGREGPPR